MTVAKARFVEIVRDVSGGNPKLPQSEYLTTGKLPVVDQGQSFVAGYTNDETYKFRSEQLPVVVFGDHTKAVKFVDFPFVMGADGVKVLKPKDGCDAKYLYHFLRHAKLPDAGYSRHFKFLKELKLPLPTLVEQRRIAAILDKADALRAKRREAIAKLDQLLQSVFLDMFGDPVLNLKGWKTTALGELGQIHTGRTPPTKIAGMFGGSVPFVTPGDLDVPLVSTDRTLTSEGALRSKVVRAGSALVGCIGNIGKIGKAAQPSAFNQQINAVEWDNDLIDDDFGCFAMRFAKPQMLALASSTVVPILNKTGFSRVKLVVPPVRTQKRFAEIHQQTERQRDRLKLSMLHLDSLFLSLQHRAFSGTL